MSDYCENCGCRVYHGACTNCDEEVFIADQYSEQGMKLPDESSDFEQKLIKAEQRQLDRLRNHKTDRRQ